MHLGLTRLRSRVEAASCRKRLMACYAYGIMSQPTYDDVNLILRLYEQRREPRMRDAREWFTANFKNIRSLDEMNKLAPPGSGMNASFRMVVTYWEMVASFINSGVLNAELFFQSGLEMALVFERIKPVLPAVREAYGNPKAWKNLEIASGKLAAWMGEAEYAAFAKRVGG